MVGNAKQDSTQLGRRGFLGLLVATAAALNVYIFGNRLGWWRSKHVFSFDGPFTDGQRVTVDGDPCSFVAPGRIAIKHRREEKDDVLKLGVAFAFKGEKRKSNHVQLKVLVRDDRGELIGSTSLLCSDGRIGSDEVSTSGGVTARNLPLNTETMRVRLRNGVSFQDIRKLELVFTDFSKSFAS